MTIVEFLRARLAEVQADAQDYLEDSGAPGTWSHWVYAQCAAQWAILAAAETAADTVKGAATIEAQTAYEFGAGAYRNVLRTLAATYSHHPDYRPEWKP